MGNAGFGVRILGFGCPIQCCGCGSGCRVQGFKFRVQGLQFKLQGVEFRIQASGLKVKGVYTLMPRLNPEPGTRHPKLETLGFRGLWLRIQGFRVQDLGVTPRQERRVKVVGTDDFSESTVPSGRETRNTTSLDGLDTRGSEGVHPSKLVSVHLKARQSI